MRKTRRLSVVFILIGLLCALCACGKDRPDAQADNIPEQSEASGVSVRVPGTQYRLARTELELLDFGTMLLPYTGGAVLNGVLFSQDAAEEPAAHTPAAAFYTQQHGCVVQTLPVSQDGDVQCAALENERLAYLEAAQSGTAQWVLHCGEQETVLDDALTGISHVEAMAVQDGTVYFAADAACVLACSKDGALLWKQATPAICRFFPAQDGRLLAWARQEQVIYVVEDGRLDELCRLPELFCTGAEQIYSGINTPYDCLVGANDAVFGWSIEENTAVQLFTCDAVGLYAADVMDFCCIGENRYLGLEWNPAGEDSGGCRLFWMTPTEGKITERRTVRVAGSRSGIYAMAVRDFASLYPEYQIEFVDYDSLYGEQAAQRLLLDMLYGDCPDLLFVNGLPYVQYARQGLLEDLYTWVDKDDTLCRADFTQNLLHALETDGALYVLPQTYQLETVIGLPSVVGSRETWSMAEFLDTAQEHPEASAVFAPEDGVSMLQLLLLHAPTAFVDYDAGKASFDSADFLRLLELAMAQTTPEADTPREALLSGQALLEMQTVSDAQTFDEAYTAGLAGMSFPGFPGAGRADFYLTLPMAIPVHAQEKDGAWAFLKLLITEDLYAVRGRGGWLPLQADFERRTADMQNTGAQELLRTLQAEASAVFYYDEAVQTILADELPYALSGAQTAAQIAARIQGRVQLYLDEIS